MTAAERARHVLEEFASYGPANEVRYGFGLLTRHALEGFDIEDPEAMRAEQARLERVAAARREEDRLLGVRRSRADEDRKRAHYEARVAKGLCVRCGDTAVVGLTLCPAHRAMVTKDGVRSGEQHGRARLTWERVATLRADFAAGVRFAELGRRYGISPTQARRLALGENWKVAA